MPRSFKLLAFTILAVLLLPGCSGLFGTAGQTHASFEFDPATGGYSGEIHDGKDREGAHLEIQAPDGTRIVYDSTGSVGSAGQAEAFAAVGKLADKIPDAGDLVRLAAPGAGL